LRPIAPSQISQREEGFPDIGGSIVEVRWEVGASVGDGVGMIEDEAGGLAPEDMS